MAKHETTFGSLQVDERFNKLQRSLKLAILKQENKKSAHNGKTSMITWPSVSSINVDTLSSNSATSSMQSSSEILSHSNNLRNVLLKKKSSIVKQGITTSSVKEYHAQQDNHVDRFTMPPPASSTVYRASKEPLDQVRTSSNCEKAATLLNRAIQSSIPNTFSLKSTNSWISTSASTDKNYSNIPVTSPTSTKVEYRVFSNWKVMLNDQYELIIKGTLECGRIARSKPVIRRYSAICVESKYKHKYVLQGNIVDERNGLPDYIRGKFYNGFPDDWENVYQIWRTYISKGCPAMFRWPTPITDSDDDLNSELTDLTYAYMKNNDSVSTKESCNLQCTKTKNLNNASEKKEKYNYSTRNLQNYEKNTSFEKPISDLEKDVIPVVQTRNPLRDEDNKQNVNPDINPPSGSRKVSKLNDILQEDKLNIILNNLVDKNCSRKYIDKIIEMFDCLNYVVSYRSGSECNNSMASASYKTSNNSAAISLQRSELLCDDNRGNDNKLTDLKNYGHSTDLGYGSIKNDFNAMLTNPVKLGNDDDSDKSESETYAGVPKISIERVLKARETSRSAYKRKVREKTVYPVAQKHASSNLPCNAESEIKFGSVYANPVADTKKNSIPEDSCISITEDEVEITHDTRKCREAVDIAQRPREMSFSNHRETQRNNLNVYRGGKSAMHVQDDAEAQKVNLNVFIKEQKVIHRNIQENARSQFVADVDYTNSDVDVMTVSTDTRKTGRTATVASHVKTDQDIVISNESNSDSPEKPCASSDLHREFIEPTEINAIKKSKPTIISLVPMNLKLKIHKVGSKARQPHDSKIIVKNGDKQDANVRPLEESDKKSMLKTSVAAKSAINDSHSKTTTVETVNNKRKICLTTNNKNEDNINPTNSNPTNAQPKSGKLGVEKNPKVLTAWTPNVVSDAKSELGLVFQGKLLNEAGHVMHRKFTTDIVARRLTATLIQTKNHEFYELLGHLNDNNHTIPKELARQCRYGCPAKIEQFCETWETLQHDKAQEIEEKLHNTTTMESLNTRVSSRGRRIIPPLCYWTGERITLKNNNPVYSPGNSQESLLLSLPDNSKVQKESTDIEKIKNQNVNSSKKQNVNEQILLPESCKTFDTNKNHTIVIEKVQDSKTSSKTANNVKRSNNLKKFRKSVNSRRLAQKLTFSSTSSSDEEQEVSPRKRMRNFQTNENADPKTSSPYTMTLRKRQKIEKSSNRILRKHATKHYADYYSPTKRNQEMTYVYYQSMPQSKDFLSENEESSI